MQRLNPLNDFIFQKLLGEKGDEEQLLSFLNAVLNRTGSNKLASVEIPENKTLNAELIGDKTSILDIRAVTGNSTRINIEVQLRNLGNMDRRSLFYWSREYAKGIEAGQDYKELPNVIAINIINFEFIGVDNFHTTFHLWEDTHKHLLTDALEIHFIEIPKYKRLLSKDIRNEPLHRWLTFFDKDAPSEVLKEVFNMDTAIKKANEKMVFISKDKDALRLYEMREMALSDYTSGINHAGERKAVEIAKNLLREHISTNIISKATGLDEHTIKQLQDELNKE